MTSVQGRGGCFSAEARGDATTTSSIVMLATRKYSGENRNAGRLGLHSKDLVPYADSTFGNQQTKRVNVARGKIREPGRVQTVASQRGSTKRPVHTLYLCLPLPLSLRAHFTCPLSMFCIIRCVSGGYERTQASRLRCERGTLKKQGPTPATVRSCWGSIINHEWCALSYLSRQHEGAWPSASTPSAFRPAC